MKYFGTDGIRMHESRFTEEFLKKVAYATLFSGEKHILIGRDTRPSGVRMEKTLAEYLAKGGATVEIFGVLTTPMLAYLASVENAVGIMISASHNPYTDNGIKFFRKDGAKFTEEEEMRLEKGIDAAEENPFPVSEGGIIIDSEDKKAEYGAYFAFLFPDALRGKRIVIDGANGGGSFSAPKILESLGASVRAVFCDGTGTAINEGCGATHAEVLQSLCKEGEIGIALDGDGDRCIAVADGKIFDGDAQLYVAALELHRNGKLNGNSVVGTLMTNTGLEKSLSLFGIGLERVNVGDKYISRRMTEKGYSLGGETSGHLIFSEFMPTGDGLLSGILFAAAKERPAYQPYYQAHCDFKTDEAGREKFLKLSSDLWQTDRGRTVVRLSGTEGKVRVMAECPNEKDAQTLAEETARRIKAAIE